MTKVICENDEIVAIYSSSYIQKEQPTKLPVWLGLIAWVLGFGVLYGLMIVFLTL